LTAVCPKNFDACRVAFPHARNLACFFMMHRHLLKIDDKLAWKFIALQQAGLRPGKPHHAFSMPLSDVKEHQEISDAATPCGGLPPKRDQTTKRNGTALRSRCPGVHAGAAQ
jgi:hypothetical protein